MLSLTTILARRLFELHFDITCVYLFGTVNFCIGDESLKRRLKDISLQWKLGGAVFFAILVSLVLVWCFFDRAVDDVSGELWKSVRKIAQAEVNSDLGAAYALYRDLGEDIHLDVSAIARSSDLAFHVVTGRDDMGRALEDLLGEAKSRFSFLCVFDADRTILGRIRVSQEVGSNSVDILPTGAKPKIPSVEVIEHAMREGRQNGTMVLSREVLSALWLEKAAKITIRPTPGARAPEAAEETRGMVVASIVQATVEGKSYFVFGGRLLNNSFAFVDELQRLFYDQSSTEAAGTASVFLDNVRISTNVKDHTGRRAIGTLLSTPVEQTVLRDGDEYEGTAFVVDREYFTGYHPIYDVFGSIAGILYVGVPCEIYRNPQQLVSEGLQERMRKGFVHVLLLSLVIALLIAFLGVRFVNSPLVYLKKCTEDMAEGRLQVSIAVDGEDEIGSLALAFRHMSENLLELVLKVKSAIKNINTSASQISSTMGEHGSTTAQQSAAVSETTATLEELAASSRQIADNAVQVVKMAGKTEESAKNGVDFSKDTLEKMKEMRSADKEDIASIKSLSEKLERIDEVMELIGNISDQSKLIAFNASIEAAGAGEAGKRFAVVSSQIRKLASDTREQAAEISAYVAEIRSKSAKLVRSRERTSGKVLEALEMTENISTKLKEILGDSKTVLSSSKQISLATQQQRTATEQTLGAVKEINEGVTVIDEGAKSTKSELDNLINLANDLNSRINRFDV
mgnify:FL=1